MLSHATKQKKYMASLKRTGHETQDIRKLDICRKEKNEIVGKKSRQK